MSLYKNTASQKVAVFAYDKTTGAAKTGDAANITGYVSLDWGAANVIDDTNPTELDATNMPGWYVFDLTQTETNGEVIVVAAKSATANILIDQIQIFTENLAANHTGTVGSVTAGVTLANDAITAAVIATDAIDADAIADNAINAGAIAANAITDTKIATGAITAAKFAAGAIDAAAIATGAIDADAIADGAIDAGAFAADAITAAKLAADVTTELQSGLATAASIAALNNLSAAQVNAEVDTALTDIGLDHLLAASVAGADVTDNSIVAKLVSKSATADWDSFANTTDALEALRDRGDAAWITATGFSTLDAAGVRSAVGLASANLDTQLDAIPTAAEINAEVDAALADIHLDHLLAADYDPASKPGVATALLNELVESDAGVSRYTANALEQAPSGTGASAATIADAVWDEVLADHQTAGSTGEALGDAGSAGDPWGTALPGAYGAGTAGKILGDNLNATVSSRATQASVDDIPTNAELSTALGTADDATLAAIAALNNLSAAQVNAEVVDVLRTDTIPDSYAADGAQPTIAQAILAIHQFLMERSISGTTLTVKKPDGSTTALTLTLSDADNPTSITRSA